MAKRSRLTNKAKKRSTQTLILTIVGIVLILFILLKYGIPFISDLSFFTGQVTSTDSDDEQSNEDEDFIPVPQVDPLPKATNKDEIKVTGTSLSGLTVQLYLNGSRDEEMEVSTDGSFEFSTRLTEGENIIKLRAVKNEKEGEFTSSSTVKYSKKNPELTIESPSEGANISGANPIEVKGKTDQGNRVIVNDFQAIINPDGSWHYNLTLKGGDNEIKVTATDTAGNKTEKIIHVNYSQ